MRPKSSAIDRQFMRDERGPHAVQITALMHETARCFDSGLYDAGLAMMFIELDIWAYLMRPEKMTKHGRASFKWFIDKYLRGDPAQEYQYGAEDAYAARCGILHTLGSLSDLHQKDPPPVIWRFHHGTGNTYVPDTKTMAYISVARFRNDASAAIEHCLTDVMADLAVNRLFGQRMQRVSWQAGVLPSRDPEAIAVLDPAIDAAAGRRRRER